MKNVASGLVVEISIIALLLPCGATAEKYYVQGGACVQIPSNTTAILPWTEKYAVKDYFTAPQSFTVKSVTPYKSLSTSNKYAISSSYPVEKWHSKVDKPFGICAPDGWTISTISGGKTGHTRATQNCKCTGKTNAWTGETAAFPRYGNVAAASTDKDNSQLIWVRNLILRGGVTSFGEANYSVALTLSGVDASGNAIVNGILVCPKQTGNLHKAE